MSEPDEHWGRNAGLYLERFSELPIYNESYQAFLKRLPKGGSVLELGCGPGIMTRYILEHRPDLHVLATDFSEGMLEVACQNEPKASYQLLNAREGFSLSMTFDGIAAGLLLPHLPAEENVKMISQCNAHLCSGGTFYLSTIENDGDHTQLNSSHTHYWHARESLENWLNDAGFSIIDSFRIPFIFPGYTQQNHLALVSVKR